MSDRRPIEFIASRCESLRIHHNAHRETHTTVARHLLHRERLGDVIIFASTASRVRCMESEAIWEVSIRHRDDTQTHIAGTSLDECMELANATMRVSTVGAIAA
ncbi:hypothetical protein [Sphingobium sp. Leaf26]|uniref:hypothetical protein n=1 Tax=Sphingobium sp. Leaf26 TaxID=1735693 RepID=UPI000A84293A|nr:hypothetical protein [Sphingobium sp. Leaf26]